MRTALAGATPTLLLATQLVVGARAADLSVTVTYTGKGTVDDTHEILVFLFNEAPSPPAFRLRDK